MTTATVARDFILTPEFLDRLTLDDADVLAFEIDAARDLSPADKMQLLAELSAAVEPLLYVED